MLQEQSESVGGVERDVTGKTDRPEQARPFKFGFILQM